MIVQVGSFSFLLLFVRLHFFLLEDAASKCHLETAVFIKQLNLREKNNISSLKLVHCELLSTVNCNRKYTMTLWIQVSISFMQ
jgi:hypothetical protein